MVPAWYKIRGSRSDVKALILIYYDMVKSEVKKDVKAVGLTFTLRMALRLNFIRLDLVPQSGKSGEANKSRILCGTEREDMRGHSCVHAFVCESSSSRGVFVNRREKTKRLNIPCAMLRLRGGSTAWINSAKCWLRDTNREQYSKNNQGSVS